MSRHAYAEFLVIFAAVAFLFAGCGRDPATQAHASPTPDAEVEALHSAMAKVTPFFKPMGKPAPLDWLASHTEAGQTFDEYIASSPTLPTETRKTLYVVPVGSFTPRELRVIRSTNEFLSAFYDLPVKLLETQKFVADPRFVRIRQQPQKRQIRTAAFLDEMLPQMLPADAAALIAFTNEDLYPDESMTFVFGQASLEKRVGVWSLQRLEANADDRTFLLRTLKIAAHETGHMFSMHHCTKYECVMSGSNYLGETDSRPVDACPECMAKICWLSKTTPAKRYLALANVCLKIGLADEAAEFERKAAAVS